MKRRFILLVFSLLTIIAVILFFSSSGQAYTIDANQGTIGSQVTVTDSGFGSKKGKVLIGTANTKIINWGEISITFEVTKSLPPGTYDVVVRPKEPKGANPITYKGAFTIYAPEIVSVTPKAGLPGDAIELSGNYFGGKKGIIYLGSKKCKVLLWTMDKVTGASQVKFVVPKKMAVGAHDISMTNKVDSNMIAKGFEIIKVDTSTRIGPEGGAVEITDATSPIYGARMDIPQETVSEVTSFSLSHIESCPSSSQESFPVGPCIDFGPSGSSFAFPILISIPYQDTDNDGLIDGTDVFEMDIGARYFDETIGQWVGTQVIGRDVERNIIHVETNHFTNFIATGGDQDGDSCANATRINLYSPINRNIDYYGDSDYFKIEVPSRGQLEIYTMGDLDTVGYLENSNCATITSNDDLSSSDFNFHIKEPVTPGTYYVGVETLYGQTIGNYTLSVMFWADPEPEPVENKVTISVDITHERRGDLVIDIGVGNPDSPIFRKRIFNHEGGDAIDLYLTKEIDIDPQYFPPSTNHTWYMKVYDGLSGHEGYLDSFRVTRGETTYHCNSSLPKRIRDLDTVFAYVNGSVQKTNLEWLYGHGPDDHGDSCSAATPVKLNSSIYYANLDPFSDYDYFKIVVPQVGESGSGRLTVYTAAHADNLDTFGYLMNKSMVTLKSDDNSGDGSNFKITHVFSPAASGNDTFYVAVKHRDRLGSGEYDLHVVYTFETQNAVIQPLPFALNDSQIGEQLAKLSIEEIAMEGAIRAIGEVLPKLISWVGWVDLALDIFQAFNIPLVQVMPLVTNFTTGDGVIEGHTVDDGKISGQVNLDFIGSGVANDSASDRDHFRNLFCGDGLILDVDQSYVFAASDRQIIQLMSAGDLRQLDLQYSYAVIPKYSFTTATFDPNHGEEKWLWLEPTLYHKNDYGVCRKYPEYDIQKVILTKPDSKPNVIGTDPANGATNVSRNLEWVYVNFDKQMKFEMCLAISPGALPAGWNFLPNSGLYGWTSDGKSFRFSRTNTTTLLSPNTRFQFTLNPVPSSCTHHFQDAAGNLLDTYTFSFTTGN